MTLATICLLAIPQALYDGSTDAAGLPYRPQRDTGPLQSADGGRLGAARSDSGPSSGRGTEARAGADVQRGERGSGVLRHRELASTPPRVDIGQPAFYDSRCHDAYQAVRWYRARYNQHRHILHLPPAPRVETGMQCPRLRERGAYWVKAAKTNRIAASKWGRTIHIRPDWKSSAIEVQKPYPGTYNWLMSCSSAEGGHGRWVWYGGRSWQGYHIGGDTVGGQMQFRYSTFAPYYRHAIENLRLRHFIIPDLGDGYEPWLSPLGQAITAGYMRYYGKDGHHWSASVSSGCR